MNTFRVSNSLDPDQARQNVGPVLGPNCLQRLSEDTSRQRDIGFLWPDSHMIDNNQINEGPMKRKTAHTPRSCGYVSGSNKN